MSRSAWLIVTAAACVAFAALFAPNFRVSWVVYTLLLCAVPFAPNFFAATGVLLAVSASVLLLAATTGVWIESATLLPIAALAFSLFWFASQRSRTTGAPEVVYGELKQEQAEPDWQESHERLQLIFQRTSDLITIVSPDGTIIFASPAIEALTGFAPEDVVGKQAQHFAHPDDRDQLERALREALQAPGARGHVWYRSMRRDGTYLDVEAAGVNMVDDPIIGGLLVSTRDITKRKAAEKALRESEERYRSLFENANDIVYTHDLSGRFLTLNRVGEQLTGYSREDVSRMQISDVVAPGHLSRALEMIAEKISGSDPTVYELEIVSKEGRLIPVEVSTRLIFQGGEPIAVQGIARDITERKEAEAAHKALESQVQHAQKLESLGVLAGGIAHDFNNLLTGVLGNASLALMDLPSDSPMRKTIEHIESAAQRAAELCRQLLAYSGKGKYVVTRVDINELIEGMGELLKASVGATVEVAAELGNAVPPIEGDASQIRQIILNLVINASDALEGRTGRVALRTGVRICSREELAQFVLDDELPEGEYAYIEVEDEGCGMDAETRRRIFEPFFTTKFTGRGLGMPAVLGIVRAHHGGIRLASEPGEGAIFTVFLPTAALPAAGPPAPDAGHHDVAVEGRQTVLVADDERMVRELACTLLKRVGYRVFAAADGQAAVDLYRNHAHEIDIVLLDMTMPRLTGQEAFEAMREIRGDVRVILSSGYSESEAVERFPNKGLAGFIQKPYRPQELFQKVGEALSAPA
jgi:two-component system, cell cycle sensor histidine kinase and response regulator CckA